MRNRAARRVLRNSRTGTRGTTGEMTSLLHEQHRPIKSADADRAARQSSVLGSPANSAQYGKQPAMLPFERLFSSHRRSTSAKVVKNFAVGSTDDAEQQSAGSLGRLPGRVQRFRSGVVSGVPQENVTWVVRSPTRLPYSRTPETRDRGTGEIDVKVRLLAADTSQVKKTRKRKPLKRPTAKPPRESHFRVYQAQRRGEQPTRLVTGRTIAQSSQSVCEQSTNRRQSGPKATDISRKLQGGEPRLSSKKLSGPVGTHAQLPVQSVNHFEPRRRLRGATSSIIGKAASEEAEMSSVTHGQPNEPAKVQRVVTQETGKGEKPCGACGSAGTMLSSFLSSLSALSPIPAPYSVAPLNGSRVPGHLREHQQAGVSWEKSSAWPSLASTRMAEPVSPLRLPLSLERTTSPIMQDCSSTCWTPFPCESESVQYTQKLPTKKPVDSGEGPSVLQPLSSPAAAASTGDATSPHTYPTAGVFRPYLVRCGGCAKDLTDACRAPAPGGPASDSEKRPGSIIEASQTCAAEDTQRVPHQPSILQRIFSFEKVLSKKPSADNTRPSGGAKRALECHANSPKEMKRITKLPCDSARTLETIPKKKEYAIFLPRRVRAEEMGKYNEVPVVFRMLHRRKPAPQLKEIPPLPPKLLPPSVPFKQAFHFRVLQQQKSRDEEKRRLVTFKAPTHCRAQLVSSGVPRQYFEPPRSSACSSLCGSAWSKIAQRHTSASSTSSLITLQYVHNRAYAPTPRLPGSEIQRGSQEFLRRVTVSPFASRVAQQTIRRVARKRAEQKAKNRARQAVKQQAGHADEELATTGELQQPERAQTCVDSLWSCSVKECKESQVSSGEGNETGIHSPVTESSSRVPREIDAESWTSEGESEALEGHTEQAVPAQRASSLCKRVGDWLTRELLSGKGRGESQKSHTNLPSQQRESAVEDVCSSEKADDESTKQSSPKLGGFPILSCCKPETRDKIRSGQPPPLVTYREAADDANVPPPSVDYLQAAAGVVAPPLYSLPVVSFLPPVFEPLPVVDTVSMYTSLQMPTCCLTIPSAPPQTFPAEQHNCSSRNRLSKAPSDSDVLTNRVRICVLPPRE